MDLSVTNMATLTDLIAGSKDVGNAKARRDAAVVELNNTCALFNSLNVELPNVRKFMQFDKKYDADVEN